MEHQVRYTNHFNGYITIEKGKEKVTLHANILGEVLRAYGIKIATENDYDGAYAPKIMQSKFKDYESYCKAVERQNQQPNSIEWLKKATQYEIHMSVMPDNNMSVSEEEYNRVNRLVSLKGYFTRIPLKWGVIQEVTDTIYKGYLNWWFKNVLEITANRMNNFISENQYVHKRIEKRKGAVLEKTEYYHAESDARFYRPTQIVEVEFEFADEVTRPIVDQFFDEAGYDIPETTKDLKNDLVGDENPFETFWERILIQLTNKAEATEEDLEDAVGRQILICSIICQWQLNVDKFFDGQKIIANEQKIEKTKLPNWAKEFYSKFPESMTE